MNDLCACVVLCALSEITLSDVSVKDINNEDVFI